MENNEQGQKQGTENTGAGIQPATGSLLEQVRAERERADKAIAELRTQLKEIEKLREREILGGITDAGQPQEKKKEISPLEYAKAAERGIILK